MATEPSSLAERVVAARARDVAAFRALVEATQAMSYAVAWQDRTERSGRSRCRSGSVSGGLSSSGRARPAGSVRRVAATHRRHGRSRPPAAQTRRLGSVGDRGSSGDRRGRAALESRAAPDACAGASDADTRGAEALRAYLLRKIGAPSVSPRVRASRLLRCANASNASATSYEGRSRWTSNEWP